MKKRIVILSLFLICLSLLAGCMCQHEWTEATCSAAKTCSKCEKTEGAPLGHVWYAATCTAPKTCSVCDETEGIPLEHTPGEKQETFDFIAATKTAEEFCSVCNTAIGTSSSPLTSFIGNKRFLFTPREFLDRFAHIAKETYPDFHYEIYDGTESLLAYLYWSKSKSDSFSVTFFSATSSNITILNREDADTPGLWCIDINAYGSGEEIGTLISREQEEVLFKVIDPLLDESVLESLQLSRFTTFLNFAIYQEETGNAYENDVMYEFQFKLYETSDGKLNSSETIQFYAANWME